MTENHTDTDGRLSDEDREQLMRWVRLAVKAAAVLTVAAKVAGTLAEIAKGFAGDLHDRTVEADGPTKKAPSQTPPPPPENVPPSRVTRPVDLL